MTETMWKLPKTAKSENKLRLHADENCRHLLKANDDPVRVNAENFEDWRRCDHCTDRQQTAQQLKEAGPDEVFEDG